MKTRTWPIGTTKSAIVGSVDRSAAGVVLACVTRDDPDEGFVLVERPGAYRKIAVGDEGVLRFVSGGPTGAHWQFEKGPQP